jgi:hypothetical protein
LTPEFVNTGSATTDYSILVTWKDQLIMFRGPDYHIIDVNTETKESFTMTDKTEKWSYFPPVIFHDKAYFVSYKDIFLSVNLREKSIK